MSLRLKTAEDMIVMLHVTPRLLYLISENSTISESVLHPSK